MAATPQWDLVPGDAVRRVDLHARYGGRVQGGMTTSTRSPNIFLFTDPRVGERQGYFDGGKGPISTTREWDNTVISSYAIQTSRCCITKLAAFLSASSWISANGYLPGEFDVDEDQPVYQMDAPNCTRGRQSGRHTDRD
jgi:hypothetical protein